MEAGGGGYYGGQTVIGDDPSYAYAGTNYTDACLSDISNQYGVNKGYGKAKITQISAEESSNDYDKTAPSTTSITVTNESGTQLGKIIGGGYSNVDPIEIETTTTSSILKFTDATDVGRGIDGYYYSRSIDGKKYPATNPMTISSNGYSSTYYIWVKDAGNNYSKYYTAVTIVNKSVSNSNNSKYLEYNIGDAFKVGNETFYCIEPSDETSLTVTGIAKNNLNRDGTLQLYTSNYSDTSCDFSSTYYWKGNSNTSQSHNQQEYDFSYAWNYENDSNINRYSGFTKYQNINNISTTDNYSAIFKSQKYATNLGGTGRLLTLDEAMTLVKLYPDLIYGYDNENDGLQYWLGTTSAGYAYTIHGNESSTFGLTYYNKNDYNGFRGRGKYYSVYGVRPVITISKNKITN